MNRLVINIKENLTQLLFKSGINLGSSMCGILYHCAVKTVWKIKDKTKNNWKLTIYKAVRNIYSIVVVNAVEFMDAGDE